MAQVEREILDLARDQVVGVALHEERRLAGEGAQDGELADANDRSDWPGERIHPEHSAVVLVQAVGRVPPLQLQPDLAERVGRVPARDADGQPGVELRTLSTFDVKERRVDAADLGAKGRQRLERRRQDQAELRVSSECVDGLVRPRVLHPHLQPVRGRLGVHARALSNNSDTSMLVAGCRETGRETAALARLPRVSGASDSEQQHRDQLRPHLRPL